MAVILHISNNNNNNSSNFKKLSPIDLVAIYDLYGFVQWKK